MSESETLISFQEARLKHNISLFMIAQEAIEATGIDIDINVAQLLDIVGVGRVEVVDAMLAALSRLSGVEYNRENVGQMAILP